MTDPNHDPISYTALKVLQQRARNCTIPMCREMAEAAGIPWKSTLPRRVLRRLIGGKAKSGLYLQLRHDAMTEALKEYPGHAILELAAGLGTRGVLECPSREAYIETDLNNLLRRKEKVVATLRGGQPAPNHYFMPVNVTNEVDIANIAAFIDSLQLQKPIVIIHEGLFMYFSEQEQALVRDNIAGLMANHKPGGIWLTPDFSERDIDQTFLQKIMSFKLRGHVGRRLNYFADNDAVVRFLQAGNLKCEWLPNSANPEDASTHAYAEYFRIHKITHQTGSKSR